jgi:hypothetical protein
MIFFFSAFTTEERINFVLKFQSWLCKKHTFFLIFFLFIYSYINTVESSQGLALSAGSYVYNVYAIGQMYTLSYLKTCKNVKKIIYYSVYILFKYNNISVETWKKREKKNTLAWLLYYIIQQPETWAEN